MFTTLFTHAACLDHDTGLGHPECADRLRAVLAALETEEFYMLERQEAPLATLEQLSRAHPQEHVERILALVPELEHAGIDADTVMSPGSGEAALRAAGAVVAAVDAVASGHSRNAFCAVRPPGHHAEYEKAMGFCLFNNAAVGAYHARAAHGLQRVAVMDFDVHHGNGTQDIFQRDPDLLYCSTHQSPLYPGTGDAGEKGEYGNCVNAPLAAMSGSPEFRHAMTHIILPAIDHFKPDLLIISAGFDAHSRDPLAGLHLTDDDFAWATRKLGDLARTHCGARIVSVLEGGYNLRALATATAAHVRELMYC
ncbi:acetoin utilization deacetylase AcuC-like enzyme [Azospirillum brasilense]|uniref:Acetoin utilization deacetylase AcuC-like enzyme n=1 Tax=Azospirillum brasilense TaxID=192 RepID=A0A560AMS1_AZOBR|nr:histone deacetylase family protein [Azospirillum brasilense]TWA61657.1 acetoin utilization deacetylase AcuC-like enzyme [Azospirillum brasilense]